MKLMLFDIREMTDLSAAHLLTDERRERMTRFCRDEDKKRCLAAGLLLRRLLGDAAHAVRADAYGKLYLPGCGVRFNLSHSGDYVALAADADEIGVDVERIADVPDGVARRCFKAEELSWLKRQSDEKSAFYRLWTGKESVMKATGLGFSMPPETFSILPMADGAHQIGGRTWHMRWYPLEGHALCVSSARGEGTQMERLSLAQLIGYHPQNGGLI